MVWFGWLAATACAQVDAESFTEGRLTPGPGLDLSAGAGLTTGNVTSAWWKASGDLRWVRLFPAREGDGDLPPFLRDRAILYGSGLSTSYDHEVVDTQELAHLRYTRMWVRRFGTEAFAQLQRDPFELLARRLLGGAGVRVDAIHAEPVGLWGGTGLMLEDEALSTGSETLALRSTSYATLRVTLGTLAATDTVYVQPRIDDPADLRVLDDLSLKASVTKVLTLGTDLSVREDTRPPEGVLPTDVRLGSSLTVSLSRPPPSP